MTQYSDEYFEKNKAASKKTEINEKLFYFIINALGLEESKIKHPVERLLWRI